ncbi:MAG: hypothetical protein AAF682_15850 [Planctomycetota bacterium]
MSPTQLQRPAPAAGARGSEAGTPKATARGRRVWPRVLKLTRRLHLYAGLALLPWVLLYGVTGILFNHADWWSKTERLELGSAELAAADLDLLPEPGPVADQAFARLAALAAEAGVELERGADDARWLGRASLSGSSDALRVRLLYDPELRGGTLYLTPRDDESELPAWQTAERLEEWSPMEKDEREAIGEAGKALLTDHGAPLEKLSTRLPKVRLHLQADGAPFVCDVGMDGKIDVQPAAETSTLRGRLLRLHVQHGDSGYRGALRSWFWIVDVMGIAMVLWSLTGLVMWWSIRPTRQLGGLALLIGALAMVGLAGAVWFAAGV